MAKCVVCGKDGVSVCGACERITGVREMAPARRRMAPCARCNHAKLIRVIPRELSVMAGRDVGDSVDSNVAHYAPMFATYAVIKQRIKEARIFVTDPQFSSKVYPPPPDAGFGVFETYICKRCGFVDWYCQDPDSIPIGPEFMTEEVDSDASEPYR